MEVFKEFWAEYSTDILTYILTALSYFLVFFYKHKINGTKTTLDVVFKENTAKMLKSNAELRDENEQKFIAMTVTLEEAKTLYETAVNQYTVLSNRVDRLQKALTFIIENTGGDDDSGEVYFDGENRTKPDEN